MNTYKVFKNLLFITISTITFISCERPRLPEEFKYKLYKYDEINCSGKAKSCLITQSGMLFFIDNGYLFQLDPYYKDKYAPAYESWTGLKGIKEILPYGNLLIGLTDNKELYLANEKKEFVKIKENIEDVEIETNDIVIIKRIIKSYATFNTVQIFEGEQNNSHFEYYGPFKSFEGFYNVKNNKPLNVDSIIYAIIDSEPIKFERASEGNLLIKHGAFSISYKELKENPIVK